MKPQLEEGIELYQSIAYWIDSLAYWSKRLQTTGDGEKYWSCIKRAYNCLKEEIERADKATRKSSSTYSKARVLRLSGNSMWYGLIRTGNIPYQH